MPWAGPEAAQYLQGLTSFDLRELTFGRSAYVPIEGFNLHVARGGYTGEDGFEVCVFAAQRARCVLTLGLVDLDTARPDGRGRAAALEAPRPAHRPRRA